MAQMAIALRARDLDPAHPKAEILNLVIAFESAGSMKLGQPQPESNLAPLKNSSAPQPTQ